MEEAPQVTKRRRGTILPDIVTRRFSLPRRRMTLFARVVPDNTPHQAPTFDGRRRDSLRVLRRHTIAMADAAMAPSSLRIDDTIAELPTINDNKSSEAFPDFTRASAMRSSSMRSSGFVHLGLRSSHLAPDPGKRRTSGAFDVGQVPLTDPTAASLLETSEPADQTIEIRKQVRAVQPTLATNLASVLRNITFWHFVPNCRFMELRKCVRHFKRFGAPRSRTSFG